MTTILLLEKLASDRQSRLRREADVWRTVVPVRQSRRTRRARDRRLRECGEPCLTDVAS
jgi:hypothetical protein